MPEDNTTPSHGAAPATPPWLQFAPPATGAPSATPPPDTAAAQTHSQPPFSPGDGTQAPRGATSVPALADPGPVHPSAEQPAMPGDAPPGPGLSPLGLGPAGGGPPSFPAYPGQHPSDAPYPATAQPNPSTPGQVHAGHYPQPLPPNDFGAVRQQANAPAALSPGSQFGAQGFGAQGFGARDWGDTGYSARPPGPALDEVALLRKARRAPSRGWRRAVHTLSAGAINPGESAGDLRYQQLIERVRQPVRGDYRIAVLSLKGGVGKTTTSVGLGATFASLRGDRVIAVDANPDLGTLAQRIPQQTASTVRNLLADANVYRYSDVRAHTSQAPSRLEVLASERDPAMAEAFSEAEYRGVITILQRFYNIIITDCGTGLSHSAMSGVLDLANAIILVSSPALDGARSAGATLDWLQAHGHGHLVSNAVVVLSSSRPGASIIDTAQLGRHFLTRCRAVHTIPFDDHLAEGSEVDLELVSKPIRHAFVELAATVADDFVQSPHRGDQPFYPDPAPNPNL